MLSTDENAHERLKLYLTIFYLLVLQFALFYYWYQKNQLDVSRWIIIPLIFSILLLPTTYGIFGRSFLFPYATIDFSDKESASRTHAVYIIRQTEKEVCIYDRINFFQVKYLPREKLKSINQMFQASPFDYSITKQTPVCDSLYHLPQNRVISDF